MKVPHVVIGIPFKGKVDLLKSFLQSLASSYISGFSWEMILLDDGSSNEESHEVKDMTSKIAKFIRHEDSIGYTKSVWEIMNESKKNCDFLLLTNNDIILFPTAITEMVKLMVKNPNTAVVGCKVAHWTDDYIIHTGTRVNKECENHIENPYCGLHINDPKTNFVEKRLWVNGCCMMYNMKIMEKENLNYNLDFIPAYFEESDLHTELNMRGYSVLYCPSATVRHLVNGTVRDYPQYGKIFSDNWKKYLDKWSEYLDTPMLSF